MTNDLDFTGSEFDPNLVQGINQDDVEGGGPTYPTLQWHYGSNSALAKKAGGMDYQGGFFINADQVDEETMTGSGWTKVEWQHDNNSITEGWYKREAAIAIIHQRKSWESPQANGQNKRFAWNKFDAAKAASSTGKASGRLHVLCMVKGLESIGPMVLTLKGSASMAFEGKSGKGGVIPTFADIVIRAANNASDAAAKKAGQRAGKRWPYRAFWCPVGADRLANGTPNFVEVGQKDKKWVALPITLGLPAKADQCDPRKYFVGAELLAQVNDLFDANRDWASAWDTLEGKAEGNGSSVEAEPEAEVEEPIGASAAASMGL